MTFDFQSRFLQPRTIDCDASDSSCDPSVRQVQREGGLVWQLRQHEGTGKITLRFRQIQCPACGYIALL